ncbi:MAG: xanthine dehydrogenase family protein molybdopterin-binding subunit [Rhizobiaceae bacterium]|nr:xanthine dehydrogenase family protein molybdopterin-binding subunit [Rhizobiaceae bacterium]
MSTTSGKAQRHSQFVGQDKPRRNAIRHAHGRGRFVDDIAFGNLAHLAFLRSPYAHAEILEIDTEAARALPGVVDVFTGPDLVDICTPWVGKLDHFSGLRTPEQYPLAMERARWNGEPVVAVVAESRAIAEDALDLIMVEWAELPAIIGIDNSRSTNGPILHPQYDSNVAFVMNLTAGDAKAAFRDAAYIVEDTLELGRQTGLTLEPRSIVADFDPSLRKLTAYHSTQTPYQMQDVFVRHFNLSEENVRVISPDVGGSFGMKLHVYGEEMAAVAASIRLGRPVKFIADRMESFLSDIHLREHKVHARMALNSGGEILAMEVDDATGIGPFSVYPRTSAMEGNQALRLMGAPYKMPHYDGTLTVLFQNKAPTCQYRAVGHPIGVTVTEHLVDLAAKAVGLNPFEIRRRNIVTQDMYPHTTATGYILERLSHEECLAKLEALMDYPKLIAEQKEMRERGIYRGIGIAAFIEITNPGPAFYGIGGARISSQDGCVIKLEPSGKIRVSVSVTEQGQGTETIMAQVAATYLGVDLDHVDVVTGDTERTPYGGATWASRGAGIGGATVMKAALAMKENILEIAGVILQGEADDFDLVDGQIVDRSNQQVRMSLAEIGRIAYFRPDTLPQDYHPQLSVSRHFVPQGTPFDFTNGVQASYLEVDVETGIVKLLNHWVVEDCGIILNQQLVDEQIRGGVVHGLGGVLFEECLYSENGQMMSATMADYLAPLASEMPDIQIDHVCTPTEMTPLGAKGVGEAGTAAAGAVVLNAVNDALRPLGGTLRTTPLTPERILKALGKI